MNVGRLALLFLCALTLCSASAADPADEPTNRVLILLSPTAKGYAKAVADELAKPHQAIGSRWFITRTGPPAPLNGIPFTFDDAAVDVRVGDTLAGVAGWRYALRLGPPRPIPRQNRWYTIPYTLTVRNPNPKAAPIDIARSALEIQLRPMGDLTAGYAAAVGRFNESQFFPKLEKLWGRKLFVALPVDDGRGHQFFPIEKVKTRTGVQPTVKFHNRLPCPVSFELKLHTRPTEVNLPPTGTALNDKLFVLAPGEKREVILATKEGPFPYGWVSPQRISIVDDALASAKK